jgi:hypothetical protein
MIGHTLEMPCGRLAGYISQLVDESESATTQKEKQAYAAQLNNLDQQYQKQGCSNPKQTTPAGPRLSMRFANGSLFLTRVSEQGDVVTVIQGGSDGDLIEMDGKGVIRGLHPEGPGDPEVRLAAGLMLRGAQLLNGTAATGGPSLRSELVAPVIDGETASVWMRQFMNRLAAEQAHLRAVLSSLLSDGH